MERIDGVAVLPDDYSEVLSAFMRELGVYKKVARDIGRSLLLIMLSQQSIAIYDFIGKLRRGEIDKRDKITERLYDSLVKKRKETEKIVKEIVKEQFFNKVYNTFRSINRNNIISNELHNAIIKNITPERQLVDGEYSLFVTETGHKPSVSLGEVNHTYINDSGGWTHIEVCSDDYCDKRHDSARVIIKMKPNESFVVNLKRVIKDYGDDIYFKIPDPDNREQWGRPDPIIFYLKDGESALRLKEIIKTRFTLSDEQVVATINPTPKEAEALYSETLKKIANFGGCTTARGFILSVIAEELKDKDEKEIVTFNSSPGIMDTIESVAIFLENNEKINRESIYKKIVEDYEKTKPKVTTGQVRARGGIGMATIKSVIKSFNDQYQQQLNHSSILGRQN